MNKTFHINCRMSWLRNDDSLYWSPLLIPYSETCSDVGSNSSLSLSWFDLSTPGYDLSNKAWRGWGNHVLVNSSVLRQGTSRTACVSSHLGGRSSVGSHDHRFYQHIVFHTWCILHLSLIVVPDADFAICVVIILQVLQLALLHCHVSTSGSSSCVVWA